MEPMRHAQTDEDVRVDEPHDKGDVDKKADTESMRERQFSTTVSLKSTHRRGSMAQVVQRSNHECTQYMVHCNSIRHEKNDRYNYTVPPPKVGRRTRFDQPKA